MATHFEVFDNLRKFGKSLDNSAKILPKFAENDEVITNKARATLTLRSMSTEANELSEDINRVKNESINANTTFEQFLVICERQTRELKCHIEQLQDHLSKYGYKKRTEKLPDIQDLQNTSKIVADTSANSSPEKSSEDINKDTKLIANEDAQSTAEDLEKQCATSPEPQTAGTQATVVEPEEFDPLRTPEPPVLTTTKLFKYPFDENGTSSELPSTPVGNTEPCPPETRTPLLRYDKIMDEKNVEEAVTIDSPMPPKTKTPLMKRNEQKILETPDVQQTSQSYLDDFPTPPVFQTPGLQRCRRREDMCEDTFTLPALPITPVTSVQLLKPEDINTTVPSRNQMVEINAMELPLINEPEYEHLPSFLKKQFPLEHVNHLLVTTSSFLSTKNHDDRMFLSDAELLPVLNLGARTKAFILLMIKLNYLALLSNGVYEVTL